MRGAEGRTVPIGGVTLSEAEQILESARGVLVVDWPSREVPDALAGGGYTVIVKGGPEPGRYSVRELRGGEVVSRELDRPPAQVDLVYCHRPIGELPGIVDLASALGAQAIWRQSGVHNDGAKDPKGCWVPVEESRQARALVEAAGLRLVEDVYIADAVRRLRPRR